MRERQHRGELEVDQRAKPDAADLLHRAHLRDADDDRAEDDRRDQHLDELDEPVAERLHRRRALRIEEAEDDADRDRRRAPARTGSNRIFSGAVLRRHSTMDPFVPRPSLRGGHRMTLYGWGNPRRFPRLPPPTIRYFDVAPDSRVLAHCHWQPRPWEHPTLVALHGLNGSSDAHYMKGIAAKAFARGMNVVRLNQRNCGDTEHLSAGLFHSGLTADPKYVIDELIAVDGLPSIAVAGYSLGGNLALKLAGEYGERRAAAAPRVRGSLAHPRDQPVRPRAGAPRERAL